ncbi:GNAT family N-acetyltransferase [Candidatus Parcubacteria bacterium]|nr:MAG: GNAT family N-acetyltransferase [Candidatus Parcubacteria bacterium]
MTTAVLNKVRWMIRQDMPSVLEIENTKSRSWNEETFLETLRGRNNIGMVYDDSEGSYRCKGFYIYSLHKRKLEILNVGVHPDHFNSDVGETMMNALKKKLSSHRRTRLVVYVRESDLNFQLWLKTQEFQATAVRQNHFDDEDDWEDAYVFQYHVK